MLRHHCSTCHPQIKNWIFPPPTPNGSQGRGVGPTQNLGRTRHLGYLALFRSQLPVLHHNSENLQTNMRSERATTQWKSFFECPFRQHCWVPIQSSMHLNGDSLDEYQSWQKNAPLNLSWFQSLAIDFEHFWNTKERQQSTYFNKQNKNIPRIIFRQ